MGSIRTGRLIHLDEHRRAELSEVGRAEHDCYVVTETHDGTLVLSPAPGWTDDDAALLARPDILELIQQDPSQLVEAPIDTTAESAATDLACLALHQARLSGDESAPRIEVSHPRFAEAVAAAIAAGDDEQRAFETARDILKGPEAAEAFGLS